MDPEPDAAIIAVSPDAPARFGTTLDRHVTVLHRYLVRRLGPEDADTMVGEVFRIAFEKRRTYDRSRPTARPWLSFGERRYEATDLEGHRWHFGERFEDMGARGGRTPEPDEAPAG